jgi:hypothetical protein
VEEALLWVTFFAHFDPGSKDDYDGISGSYTSQYASAGVKMQAENLSLLSKSGHLEF